MTVLPMSFFEKMKFLIMLPVWCIYELLPKTREEKERELKQFEEEMRQIQLSHNRREDGRIWAGRR